MEQQLGIIIKLKKPKNKRMFYYPQQIYCPQYVYYVCMPSSQAAPHETPSPHHAPSLQIKLSIPPSSQQQEERLVLTRADLEKEGYEQTKRPWSKEEDKLLMKLCKDQNARFEEIAAKMEGRNSKMCYSRFRRLTYETRTRWSKEEDQRLLALAGLAGQGGADWKAMAALFEGRTHKQLKDHYLNYLKPDLLKSEWTVEEDLELIRLINLHGKDWKLVEDAMQGRSRNQIKNRYFGRILRLNKKKLAQAA